MGVEKHIVIQGKRYSSLLEAADEFGVHKSTLARRLRYGWTPEQAVGLAEKPKRIGSAKKVVYKGHLCCVLQVHMLGGCSVPLQVFEFVSCLPPRTVATLVQHHLTTTCVCEVVIDEFYRNFHCTVRSCYCSSLLSKAKTCD